MSEKIKKYRNPPVVEAWIDFRFEYGEDQSPEWNEKVATSFLNSFEEFKSEEYSALVRKEIKIAQTGPVLSDSEPVLHRLKAFNKTKDRCLQIEQNLLVYNLLQKKGADWPGFSALLNESMLSCQSYITVFSPVSVTAVLHYRDNIVIPFTDNKIEPSDYFEIYPKVPESKVGNIIDYTLSLVLADICDNGVARVSMRTESSHVEETSTKLAFIIDWDVHATNQYACGNLRKCGEWLNLAHESINKAFESCLTEKCRAFFD